MAQYTGTSDNSDINEALMMAIRNAAEGLGSQSISWKVVTIAGNYNGGAGKDDLTVTIDASIL